MTPLDLFIAVPLLLFAAVCWLFDDAIVDKSKRMGGRPIPQGRKRQVELWKVRAAGLLAIAMAVFAFLSDSIG